jgi:hypothetical protein
VLRQKGDWLAIRKTAVVVLIVITCRLVATSLLEIKAEAIPHLPENSNKIECRMHRVINKCLTSPLLRSLLLSLLMRSLAWTSQSNLKIAIAATLTITS